MKIGLIGDFNSNSGPAIANESLYSGLIKNNTVYKSIQKRKINKIIEMLVIILKSNIICFCSYSKINLVGVEICRILGKKCVYVSHGYASFEYRINTENFDLNTFEKIKKQETKLFKKIDKVICVSKLYCEILKKDFPIFAFKITYNYNGLNLNLPVNDYRRSSINKFTVMSLGGTSHQKNNIIICDVIYDLNQSLEKDIEYILIGKGSEDFKKTNQYNFIKAFDKLTHKQVLELMMQTDLYIQNSFFETFGLAVMEALSLGCDLLIANNIGCKELIKDISDDDIIYDNTSKYEISEKIVNIIDNTNNSRMCASIDVTQLTYKHRSQEFLKIFVIVTIIVDQFSIDYRLKKGPLFLYDIHR